MQKRAGAACHAGMDLADEEMAAHQTSKAWDAVSAKIISCKLQTHLVEGAQVLGPCGSL